MGGKASHKGASPERRLNSVFVALFDVFNVISYNVYTHGYLPVSVFCCNVITGEARRSAKPNKFFLLNIRTARERAYLFFRVASDAADDDGGTTGPIPRR